MFSYSNLYLTFYKELCMVLITTKALKSGLKLRLERFKNKKIFQPWTPSPAASALRASARTLRQK